MQRRWRGNGALTAADHALGDMPWRIDGPSALPVAEDWLMPVEMTPADIKALVDAFAAAARRADALGCDFIEIHGAHGYLIQTFLSPLSNLRADAYGGDLAGRMRIALEVTEAVRAAWPDGKPLFFRISSVDGFEGGWTIEDSVVLARALKDLGVDVIDCSSGGNQGRTPVSKGRVLAPGYQLPYAAQVRREVDIPTQAVGLIVDGPQAEAALQAGQADLIAIGRQALFDPFWAVHQAYDMGVEDFDYWPEQYGWWLARRERSIQAMKAAPA
jgi:2,4-dienoyl-CoA reductase-like NADH-dependent reductase (Old Yellow Enzyme family)